MRLVAFSVALAFAAIAATPARANGAYASLPEASAADCVKLCDDDNLCVGWTFDQGACGLWASVPGVAPSAFTVSDNAPAFARAISVGVAQAPVEVPPTRQANGVGHASGATALLGGNDGPEELRPPLGGGS
jgi:hypothetical protein